MDQAKTIYFTCHQFAATSLIARRCGLLKLIILSLTSKEFSGAQQNSFCFCRSGLKLVISRGFWKLGYCHYVIGTNFQIWCTYSNVQLVSVQDPFISVHQTQAYCLLQGYAVEYGQGQHSHSFYCRAPRIWNTLPVHLRNTDCSVAHFKKDLFNYYLYLTKSVYGTDTPQTFKSVCIKCHTSQPLNSLLDRMCC